MEKSWYDIDLSSTDSPALIIDKDKVVYNIQRAIDLAGDVNRLRPHVKTHKILEVAKMQIAAGIFKYKCATIAEAEMLGIAGAREVLIAYPVQGPKINRVLALQEEFPNTQFSALIDNIDSAEIINEVAFDKNQIFQLFIDVNNGQFRTGIEIDQVEELVIGLQQKSNLEIIGLHCYDGHIRMADLEERTATCQKAFVPVFELLEKLESRLNRQLKIVAGGSPSFSVHSKFHPVECSPGTFVFWDERYATNYAEQGFEKAAVVATRVISKLDPYTYCLDLGHKSIASESPFPRVKFIHSNSFEQIGHSEEHLLIKCKEPDVLAPGELLLGFPYHICPTVALYNKVQVVEDGQLTAEWEVVARKRKITI